LITKFLKRSSYGMTLLELTAGIVVMAIIGIGMTSGAQAVMLHYQTDTVRQDLRQYGNNIMREIVRELNRAQKIEVDSFSGFARLKLYKYFTDMSPELTITCNARTGILFNSNIPVDGVLNFPSEGAFRGANTRTVYIDDFVIEYDMSAGLGSSTFKNSFLDITLVLAMESDVMDDAFQPIKEQHIYHRTAFLGTSYIQTKVTNALGINPDV
jgi:type II secretory pathway pseudopilin PulG